MDQPGGNFVLLQGLDISAERGAGADTPHAGNPGGAVPSVAVPADIADFFEFFPGGTIYHVHGNFRFGLDFDVKEFPASGDG